MRESATAAASPTATRSLVRVKSSQTKGFTSGSMMTSACWRQAKSAWRWMMVNDRLMTSAAVRGYVQVARFQIHGDDDVRAEQQRALDGNRRGEKTVNQRSVLKLNGHEQPGIRAGTAQWRAEQPARVVHGDAGVDVRRGDGEGRGELFESLCGCEAGSDIVSMRWLVARPSQEGVQRPKSAKLVVRGDALHLIERHSGAIACADQGADTGAGDDSRWECRRFSERAGRRCARCRARNLRRGPDRREDVRRPARASPVAKERNLSLAFLQPVDGIGYFVVQHAVLHFSATRGCGHLV